MPSIFQLSPAKQNKNYPKIIELIEQPGNCSITRLPVIQAFFKAKQCVVMYNLILDLLTRNHVYCVTRRIIHHENEIRCRNL